MSLGFLGKLFNNGATERGPIILRDFVHAAKTFRTDGYAYAPKFKFLFHVYFDINPQAYGIGLSTGENFGLAVKTVRLPSYNFATEQLNQYNRKRIVQTKIKYSPVNISLHDDNDNKMMRLWHAYYTYYYNDGSNFNSLNKGSRGGASDENSQLNIDYNNRNIYDNSITGDVKWGYNGDSPTNGPTKVPFFNNITVFGLNQKHFTSYTLINPVITNFTHDTYSYADGGGTMEMQMDLDYESVAYNEGGLDGRTPDQIVKGFGTQENYDTAPGPYVTAKQTGEIASKQNQTPLDAAGGFIRGILNNR